MVAVQKALAIHFPKLKVNVALSNCRREGLFLFMIHLWTAGQVEELLPPVISVTDASCPFNSQICNVHHLLHQQVNKRLRWRHWICFRVVGWLGKNLVITLFEPLHLTLLCIMIDIIINSFSQTGLHWWPKWKILCEINQKIKQQGSGKIDMGDEAWFSIC